MKQISIANFRFIHIFCQILLNDKKKNIKIFWKHHKKMETFNVFHKFHFEEKIPEKKKTLFLQEKLQKKERRMYLQLDMGILCNEIVILGE